MKKAHFIKTTVLKDTLAVRCAEFNPKGNRLLFTINLT